MKKSHIRDRIPKDLYEDLFNRRVTVRKAAAILNVSETYLSRAIPERAPKRNTKLLRITRRLYQDQVAREYLAGKHTAAEAANLAHVTLRTMYRRIAAVRA